MCSQNIFVVSKSPRWWIKIGDFGISKRVREDMTRLQTRMVGDYVAPEILNLLDEDEETSQDYTSAIDMWSLGCLTHWLLTRTTPFPNGKGLLKYCQGRAQFPKEKLSAQTASEETIDFVTSVMATMPSKRLTAEQALQHPWLASSVDASTSEDESSQTAKQSNYEQPHESKDTSPLDFDDAKTLVADAKSLKRMNALQNLAELIGPSAKTNGPFSPFESLRTISQAPAPGIAESKKKTREESVGYLVEEKDKEDAAGVEPKPQKPMAAGARNEEAEISVKNPPRDAGNVANAIVNSFNEKIRTKRQQDSKQRKLNDLKTFSKEFKLPTSVPKDLLPILARDRARQIEIAEQTQRDAAQASSLTYKGYVAQERPRASGPVKAAPKTEAPSPGSALEHNRQQRGPQPAATLFSSITPRAPNSASGESANSMDRVRTARPESIRYDHYPTPPVVVNLPPPRADVNLPPPWDRSATSSSNDVHSSPSRVYVKPQHKAPITLKERESEVEDAFNHPQHDPLRPPPRDHSATSVSSDVSFSVSEQTSAGKALSRKQRRKRAKQAIAQSNIPGNDPMTP